VRGGAGFAGRGLGSAAGHRAAEARERGQKRPGVALWQAVASVPILRAHGVSGEHRDLACDGVSRGTRAHGSVGFGPQARRKNQ
jgi:hypothetical protein